MTDVAIVGAGASGTLLAAHLLRRVRGPFRVTLWDGSGLFGPGVAYGTSDAGHLLNVRAAQMSAWPDRPDHFVQWLRELRPEANGHTFAPRRLYGEYLRSLLREHPQIERRAQVVTGLRLEADRVLLQDGSGTTHAAQKAVLAWGHFPPAPIRVPDGGLYRSPLYCPSPWTPDALRAVPPDAPVLLLGTGLTAVDALVTLKALGHHGPVEALSRHGLWPEVHAPQAATGTRAAPFQPEPTARAYLGELRRRVRTETQTGGDWRAAVDGLRPWTAQAWQRLPEKEQRRFLRHLRALWEIHRHRTAPEPGNVVSELARAGRLRTHAGRLVDFRLEGTEGGVRARIHPRGQRTVREIEVLRVVNCTGPGPLGPAASPLVAELVHGGWARVDRFGLGLETDVRGALLDAAGRPSERLYTLGPLRRGGLWESTAVPEIRAQAAALAEHLGGPG